MKKKIGVAILITMLAIAFCFAGCAKKSKKTFFLASEKPQVLYYTLENEKLVEQKTLSRGLEVIKAGLNFDASEDFTEGEKVYVSFKLEDSEEAPTYYVLKDNTASKLEECVKETSLFIRTPATLYVNFEDPSIAGFLKKGTAVDITGFDTIKEDGNVNMYQVSVGEQTGYVYPKYLVATQEEANAVNTKYYELNKDAIYSYDLLGGNPANLDYFPFDKSFDTDKSIPLDARTYYLNASCTKKASDGSYIIDSYINLAKNAGSKAMVIDIKDKYMIYQSEVAKEYSPTIYETASMTMDEYKESIDRVKEAGLWTIGRIVVFNDPQFAEDHPDECIVSDGVNQGWPSAYSRLAWEYNLKLAQEAVMKFGFDEIQFDYVRFPENAYSLSLGEESGSTDFKNTYGEEKAEAVQNFCMYASDNLHKVGAYVSVDVFGECSNGYVTAYGQYWPAISNVIDVISGMPYIDHFGRGTDTWTNPYATLYNWGSLVSEAQEITPNPAIPRTWLTCYDTPYWDPVYMVSSNLLGRQISGLYDSGVGDGGFMTWNGNSSLSDYNAVLGAFQADYS